MSEGYQRVAAVQDVPDGGMMRAELGEAALVIIRSGDEFFALDDACPHAGAPLSEGFVESGLITCSWHGWSFDVRSGESADGMGCLIGRHACRVEGDEVFVRVTGQED